MAMSKQEILEAINSTIVTNGQKGITAESLNLILNEMVESSGEGGSGEGAIRVYAIPSFILEMFSLSEITPSIWEELSAVLENDLPGFTESQLYLSVKEVFAKNTNVYNTLLEKAGSVSGTSVILDASLAMSGYIHFMGDIYGMEFGESILSEVNCSMSCPVEVSIDNSVYSDLGISLGLASGEATISLVGTSKGSQILEDGVTATLLSNGGFKFTKPASDATYQVYIPADTSFELTEELKNKNAELVVTIYNSIANAAPGVKLFNPNNIIIAQTTETGGTYVNAIRALALDFTNNSFTVTFIDNGIIQRVEVGSNGVTRIIPISSTVAFYTLDGSNNCFENKYGYEVCKYFLTKYVSAYDNFGHGFPSIQIYDKYDSVIRSAINAYYNNDTSSVVLEAINTDDGNISIQKYSVSADGTISIS